MPADFEPLVERIKQALEPALAGQDLLVVHNIFSKHFNLPLTAALFHLLREGKLPRPWAWCHDFTWTSPASHSKVFPGYPWDLLRDYNPALTYITVSEFRQTELAGLLGIPPERIKVIYNGVDPAALLGLSPEVLALAEELDLLQSDWVMLMPLRVTQAKNIELAMRVTAALKALGLSRPRTVLTGPPDPHSAENMDYYRSLLDLRRALGIEQEFRFIYGSPEQARTLPSDQVGALLRLADMIFMPSWREGFGMPVMEGGFVGVPVAASDRVPAVGELAGEDACIFSPDDPPETIAERILEWAAALPTARLKRRVRSSFTWTAIFEQQIEPLIADGIY